MLLRLWDILIMLSATSAALAIPVRLVFELPEHTMVFDMHYWGVTLMFFADMLINFFRPRPGSGAGALE